MNTTNAYCLFGLVLLFAVTGCPNAREGSKTIEVDSVAESKEVDSEKMPEIKERILDAQKTKSTRLEIRSITEADLAAIAELNMLEYLKISFSKVENYGLLKKLPNLKELVLQTPRASIEGVTELDQVESVSILEIGKDFDVLKRIPKLKQVSARGTLKPGDIDSLAALNHVDRISLTEFHNDFSVLPRIPNLYAVSMIEGCGFDDLKVLASIPTLRSLELLHDGPEDLSALGGAKQLTRLSLAENEQYRDIRFLANMVNLEELDLEDGQFEDLRPIAKLTKLRKLNLANCEEVHDLSALKNLTALTELDLRSVGATDIGPLSKLVNLRSLRLCGDIDSLEPIASLARLEELELSYCETIDDLSTLSRLSLLRRLDIEATTVRDPSELNDLKGLRELNISNCTGIRSLSSLAPLYPHLERLEIAVEQMKAMEDFPDEFQSGWYEEDLPKVLSAMFPPE